MSGVTWQIWYCQACGKVARAIPEMNVFCRCAQPVLPLKPTLVTETLADGPKPRRLQALTDEEARLRALARKGTKVRVTYEGEVAQAWLSDGEDGRRHLNLIVETPDGRRHAVDPDLAHLSVEAVRAEEAS